MTSTETKQRSFKTDKQRVDKFEPQIKQICGEVFINTAPEKIDCEQATDLLVLEIKPVTIACRVRTYEYYEKYRNQFTICNSRPSGNKCELQKILQGWCDYNFYGFADPDDNYIIQWFIGDLKVFRYEFLRAMAKEKKCISWGKRNNGDGSSDFCWFDLRTFPPEFIVAKNLQQIIPGATPCSST